VEIEKRRRVVAILQVNLKESNQRKEKKKRKEEKKKKQRKESQNL
jgi:hypothetical protein